MYIYRQWFVHVHVSFQGVYQKHAKGLMQAKIMIKPWVLTLKIQRVDS